MPRFWLILPLIALACAEPCLSATTCQDNVAALDAEFQSAVKHNDVAAIDRLLPGDYILVSSTGDVQNKADLLREAREKKYIYSHQEDSHQTVRIWENTAVLTSLLWAEGVTAGKYFNVKVWFSDTYICTRLGWRYVFGQVGAHVPVK